MGDGRRCDGDCDRAGDGVCNGDGDGLLDCHGDGEWRLAMGNWRRQWVTGFGEKGTHA